MKTSKKKINWVHIGIIAKTVVVCAIVAGAVFYHVIALRNAEKKAYLEGAKDFKQVEQGH